MVMVYGRVWDRILGEINKLTGAGYTVIFIAHQTENKDGFILPKGDKEH